MKTASGGVVERLMAVAAVGLLGATAFACGGQVVFQEDEPNEGGGGADGVDDQSECVLGGCGDPCSKCVNDACFDGVCSEAGLCVDERDVVCSL